MIEKLYTLRAMEIFNKINELIEEVNRLGKEPVPHYHGERGRGEPNSDLNWDHYTGKDK
jgi:hypothetical protein